MTIQNEDSTPQEQINQLADYAIKARTETGKIAFPEGTDPVLEQGARMAVSARDFQSSQAKTAKELAEANARADALTKAPALIISTEDSDYLKKLAVEDPEKYYTERRRIENEAESKRLEQVKQLSSEALTQQETKRRAALLELHQQSNPSIDFSVASVIAAVPPFMFDMLEAGTMTYDQILDEAKARLTTGKSILKTEGTKDPNLGKAGGSDSPQGQKAKQRTAEDRVY